LDIHKPHLPQISVPVQTSLLKTERRRTMITVQISRWRRRTAKYWHWSSGWQWHPTSQEDDTNDTLCPLSNSTTAHFLLQQVSQTVYEYFGVLCFNEESIEFRVHISWHLWTNGMTKVLPAVDKMTHFFRISCSRKTSMSLSRWATLYISRSMESTGVGVAWCQLSILLKNNEFIWTVSQEITHNSHTLPYQHTVILVVRKSNAIVTMTILFVPMQLPNSMGNGPKLCSLCSTSAGTECTTRRRSESLRTTCCRGACGLRMSFLSLPRQFSNANPASYFYLFCYFLYIAVFTQNV